MSTKTKIPAFWHVNEKFVASGGDGIFNDICEKPLSTDYWPPTWTAFSEYTAVMDPGQTLLNSLFIFILFYFILDRAV